MKKIKVHIVILLFVLVSNLHGQFYNGHQMQFGKNRVQYNDFYWTYFRYERFDIFFNEYGIDLSKHVAQFAEKELTRLESYFDYNLDDRVIFIVYNKISEFRQSNIGLITGKAETNTGGTVRFDRNKVYLYFEGDYHKFEQQITATLCRVLINEMIFGNEFRTNATNSTLINLPAWYIDGLVAYVSKQWDFDTENRVKDGVLSKKYKKFNRLQGDDAIYAGHSFWRYISETFGESVIPSILYLTKVNKNANTGFFYVVGASLKDLSKDWFYYYQTLYENSTDSENPIAEHTPILKRPKKKTVYNNIKISPSGNFIAYTTNKMGQYKVWTYNVQTGKHEKILRKEHRLEQITDYTYPTLAWHPSSRYLTFITEEEGGIRMYYYTFADKELTYRNILYFDKILSYSFSPDGSLIVMAAIKNGQTDIYVHSIAAGTNFQVTNDKADDYTPRFINNGSHIIFASNREEENINDNNVDFKPGLTTDLFIYDYEHHTENLMRLENAKFIEKIQPYETSRNKYISLSDANGTVNRYLSKFDSTISSIDTTIHYRYFSTTSPITNYDRNIIEHTYEPNSNQLAEITFRNGRYYMLNHAFDEESSIDGELPKTKYRKKRTREYALKDSLNKIVVEKVLLDSIVKNGLVHNEDTITIEPLPININNYVFELERMKLINESLQEANINVEVVDNFEVKKPKALIYQKSFYQNYLVGQLDFSFLSESYQQFTGGAVYFNPKTNVLLKVGANDLFEDYKITAAYRMPVNIGSSSEYLVNVENLKKRLNRQYLYHRQVFSTQATIGTRIGEVKLISEEVFGIFRYPHNQVMATALTIGGRKDRNILKATNNEFLEIPDYSKYWFNTKAEFIFDNTHSLGLNLPVGTRFKIFGEAYQQFNDKFDNLFVVGADFRNYIILHRKIIWANRFATSTSAGSTKLVYYLGAVDNWSRIIKSPNTPTFIPLSEIRLTPDVDYAFQAAATNLRGFSQNIRNGNSFALINSEIRWPVISYFANYPISNAFLENFQAIGFFDIGSAWSGVTPWDKVNGYDTDIIRRGPITIEIDSDRQPIVAGYGFGLRSQIFGYFVRLDWAWGIENRQVHERVFYFSLCKDF